MSSIEEYMLPCLNKSVFGIDCTGCGAQRSIALLLQGNFEGAFHMYPAIYSIIVLLVFVIFNLFFKFRHDHTIKIGLIIFNGVIIAGAYLYKMFYIFN
ncbi:uncharacterized protein DUF2752 [Gramella sp. Hel_I_59]|uniref:DUF2752 domain-containing protein n=1 Tax=Gramella sp. Hel_I_59 TaxID=1249978 RepID=UPI00116C7199|nr:uncharacterized protein DUF2752 [Gramella sp. Hel_I_59]